MNYGERWGNWCSPLRAAFCGPPPLKGRLWGAEGKSGCGGGKHPPYHRTGSIAVGRLLAAAVPFLIINYKLQIIHYGCGEKPPLKGRLWGAEGKSGCGGGKHPPYGGGGFVVAAASGRPTVGERMGTEKIS